MIPKRRTKADGKERPIPEVTGSWDIPPIWFALFFLGPGIGAAVYGFVRLISSLLSGAEGGLEAAFMLIWGLCFGGGGVVVWWVRDRLRSLAPLDDLSAQTGISPARLQADLAEKGIRPQFNVNGKPYFDPNDLNGAATLLRASRQDDSTLVRPYTSIETESDRLLRGVHQNAGTEGQSVTEIRIEPGD